MQISIKTNFPDVQRQLQAMQKGIADKAMASAMNKTMAQAKTAMSREIRAEFNMSTTKVNAALRINKAVAAGSRFRLEASLESPSKRGRSLNLINFMERSVSMAQAKKRSKAGTLNQLFVQIKKAGGKKALGSAFIGNKGRTVFVRVPGTTMDSRNKYAGTKHAQKIKALQTIDVAGMFNTKRINAKVVQMIEAKFGVIFANEARFFTERFNARKSR